MIPVGGNVHKVNIGAFAEFLITGSTIVDISGSHAGLAQSFLALFRTCFFVVAQSHNLHAGDVGKT